MKNLYVRDISSNEELERIEPLEPQDIENLPDLSLLCLCFNLSKKEAASLLEKKSLQEIVLSPNEELSGRFNKLQTMKLLLNLELAKRCYRKSIRPMISCPAETLPFLAEIKDEPKEHFLCLYLNARNHVIHKEVISIGTLSASIVHPREVLQPAIIRNAASIILAHNHPSSDVSPSKDDIELTRRLVKAGEIIGIEVIDHK
jgi:DNA repair protein RadC